MQHASIIYSFALSFYLLSSLLLFLDFKEKDKGLFRYAGLGLKAALFSLVVLLLHRFFIGGYLPLFTFYDTLLLFAFAGSFILVIMESFYPLFRRSFFFALPLITVLVLLAGFFPGEGLHLPPELQSIILFIHILSIMGAYGSLSIAFISALVYLVVDYHLKKKKSPNFLDRLPSLDVLDNITFLLVVTGFLLLTSGIILGAIWGWHIWGSYWRWEPKETWALITWLAYAAYLQIRLMSGWRGKQAVLFNIAGFGAILFNYFVVRFFLGSGAHTFF